MADNYGQKKKFLLLLVLVHLFIYVMLQYSGSYLFMCDRFTSSPTRKPRSDICLRHKFQDILLVITFNFALYDSMPILLSLYQRAFPNIYICGPESSKQYPVNRLPIHKGYFAYECMEEAMFKHRNYTGYFFLMDDVLLNFWTLVNLNTELLWEGPKQPVQVGRFKPPAQWYWWRSRWGKENCQMAFDEIAFMEEDNEDDAIFVTEMLRNLRVNGAGRYRCHRGRSDVFYVPKRFANGFSLLSSVFSKHEVFLEIAVPTIFRFLDRVEHFESLTGYYLPGRVGEEPVTDGRYLWTLYNEEINFIHPLKLHYGENSTMNFSILRNWIMNKVDALTNCRSR
eukprot:gene9062-10030_t